MATDLLEVLRLRRRPPHLTTCSVCLRVVHGVDWVEAEQVIREIRSYELENAPRLDGAVCETCMESIVRRRLYP